MPLSRQEGAVDLALFSLQGLGNSVINLPIITKLAANYASKLLVMDNGSFDFYRNRLASIEAVKVRRMSDLLKIRVASRRSFAFFPNARREYLASTLCRSGQKYFFRDPIARCAQLNFFRKFDYERCHDIENNLQILDTLGIDYLDQDFCLGSPKTGTPVYATIHPTASSPVKFYPDQFWVVLIQRLVQQGYKIYLYSGGAPDEVNYCSRIIKRLGGLGEITYRRQAPVNQVFDEIGASALFVGTDSALMHMAALQDVQTIGLWSFADFRRIYPYGNNVRVYIPKETAEADFIKGYPTTRLDYLQRCDPDAVLELVGASNAGDFSIKPRFKNDVEFTIF